MFHSRSLNNKINRPHERCLRISYNDKRSTFEELLPKENSVSVDHNNIHAIAIGKGRDTLSSETYCTISS